MTTRSNLRSTVAGLICWSVAQTTPAATINVALNYNFNGVWHGDTEAMGVTEESGFRSISDRALDFSGGVPANGTLDNYVLSNSPGTRDMVHLGNRNLTDNGGWSFNATANGDNVGIQPDWLVDVDQTAPPATTTALGAGVILDDSSFASLIYHVSNGGGSFDVRMGFGTGDDLVTTIAAGDWWAGNGLPAGAFEQFPGMGGTDLPGPDANLGLWEGTVDLSGQVGRILTSVSFENQTNASAGYGIYALNVSGTAVPEPSSLAFLGIAALGVASLRRRRG